MASDQSDIAIPAIAVSTITEQELAKPGVAKFLYKQFAELKAENQDLRATINAERARREQLAAQLSQVDIQRQVFQERLSTLGDRNAISQLIWGGIALLLSLVIDSVRSSQLTVTSFSAAGIIFLGIAVYLVNRTPRQR